MRLSTFMAAMNSLGEKMNDCELGVRCCQGGIHFPARVTQDVNGDVVIELSSDSMAEETTIRTLLYLKGR